MEKHIGSWGQLFNEIVESLKDGFKPPIFFYWLTFVVIIGGVGIWFSIGRQYFVNESFYWIIVFQNATTYSIAVLATSHADINLERQFTSSLKIFSYFILALGLALAIIVLVSKSQKLSISLGLIGLLLAFFLWFLANTKSDKFKEELVDASAATGGDTNKELKGNMTGIKH